MTLDDIVSALHEIATEGTIITNWVIVAETTNGMSTDLHIASTEGMTPWTAYGMLAAASQMVSMRDDAD